MKEIPLTSLSIFEFSADKALTENVFEEVKLLDKTKEIKWLDTTNVINPNNYSKTGYIGGNKSYYHKELFDWFQNCIDEVASTKFKNEQLKICDSWLTKTQLYQSSKIHYHAMSILSGVFYFEDFEKSSIKFYFTDPVIEKFEIFLGGQNDMTFKQEKTIQPQFGKLLIFPSYVSHEIQMNTSIKTRYSLSFNTFFNGEVSNQASRRLHIHVL